MLYGLTLAALGRRPPAPDTDYGRGVAVALLVIAVGFAVLFAGRYVRRARARGREPARPQRVHRSTMIACWSLIVVTVLMSVVPAPRAPAWACLVAAVGWAVTAIGTDHAERRPT